MMIRFENECVGCAREMGCLGSSCPYACVAHLFCDHCKAEVDTLYHFDGEEWCADCILDDCGEVEPDYYNGNDDWEPDWDEML